MKKTLLFVLALIAAGCAPAEQSETASDGSEQVTPSDSCAALSIESPLESLNSRVEQGDAVAQSNLGNMYRDGYGVPEDDAEAVRWWRLAAEQGNAYAQANLGFVYGEGRGVPQDYAEAVRWSRLAAEQGNARGQTNLGSMYGEGRGVPQDDAEAVRWWRLAAEQGNAVAQYNLERLSDGGEGAPYYLAALAGLLFVAWRALKGRA